MIIQPINGKQTSGSTYSGGIPRINNNGPLEIQQRPTQQVQPVQANFGQKIGEIGQNILSGGKNIVEHAPETIIKGLKFAVSTLNTASQNQSNNTVATAIQSPPKIELPKISIPKIEPPKEKFLVEHIVNQAKKQGRFYADTVTGFFGEQKGAMDIAQANDSVKGNPLLVKRDLINALIEKGGYSKIDAENIAGTPRGLSLAKEYLGDSYSKSIPSTGVLPSADFVPKTQGERFGKFLNQLVTDIKTGELGGINQSFEGLGSSIKGGVEASPTLAPIAGKILDKADLIKAIGSNKLKIFLNKLKPLDITFDDLRAITIGEDVTVEQIAKFERFKELNQAGLSPSQILKAAEDARVNPKTKIFDFLNDAINTLKNTFTKSLTPEEQKLLGSGVKNELESIIPQGEHTPQEILGKVINSPIENTAEGKQIVKIALDAQEQGKNVIVSANEVVSKLETPSSPVTEVASREAMSPSVKGEGVIKTSIDSPQITAPIGEGRGVTELSTSQAQQPIDTSVGEVTKQSKVGTSIETKTIEKGLSKSFSGTAEYTPIVIKEQAKLASDLINSNLDQAKRIVLGQEQLPKGMRAGTILKAMEDYALDKGDASLLRGIANSPLTAETSLHAQELRLLAERNPDSAVKIMQDIANKRKADLEDRTGRKINDAVKNEVERIKKEIRVPKKEDWNAFLDSIEC
jgi:hypothetical protein